MSLKTALKGILFHDDKDLSHILSHVNTHLSEFIELQTTHSVTSDLVHKEFFEDIKLVSNSHDVRIFFGNTLQDIRCLYQDDDGIREIEVHIKYRGRNKIRIVSVNLPHSPIQDYDYISLDNIIEALKKHVHSLSNYFCELEQIDRFCTVVEPVKPSYKDDYRRILIDERTWLHIEVTPDGMATNIHVVGQSDVWQEKLQQALLSWDHDKHIVENIMTIFDLDDLPISSLVTKHDNVTEVEAVVCAICLCSELPNSSGVPQPICTNTACGVYYHNGCLYEWLVACEGGRPPAFGVANGSCPTCLQPISCKAMDN